MRRARLCIWGVFALTALVATVQRGVLSRSHTTFPIFRQSFHHLVAGSDLYAAYPAEQGNRPQDRFKYSPTAALFFAPFAQVPFAFGLLLWNLLNVTALLFALERVLPPAPAAAAQLLVFPSTLAAVQSSSSNALIAALIMLAFAAISDGRHKLGAALVATGALIKIFPLAVLTAAWGRPNRLRFAVTVIGAFGVLVALPAAVSGPADLLRQYQSWWGMISADAHDLAFGYSTMQLIRVLTRGDFPSWPIQVIGTLLLLLPLGVRRDAMRDPPSRLQFLAFLMVYVVLFNHQAEFQSFVIASAGMAVWFVSGRRTVVRAVVVACCLIGFTTVPFSIVWLMMLSDLVLPAPQAVRRTIDPATSTATPRLDLVA